MTDLHQDDSLHGRSTMIDDLWLEIKKLTANQARLLACRWARSTLNHYTKIGREVPGGVWWCIDAAGLHATCGAGFPIQKMIQAREGCLDFLPTLSAAGIAEAVAREDAWEAAETTTKAIANGMSLIARINTLRQFATQPEDPRQINLDDHLRRDDATIIATIIAAQEALDATLIAAQEAAMVTVVLKHLADVRDVLDGNLDLSHWDATHDSNPTPIA